MSASVDCANELRAPGRSSLSTTTMRPPGASAAAQLREDAYGVVVVPIVEHGSQHVHVVARRNRREEVARDELRASDTPASANIAIAPARASARSRTAPESAGCDARRWEISAPVPPPTSSTAPTPSKLERLADHHCLQAGAGGHRVVERGRRVGMLGEIREEVDAVAGDDRIGPVAHGADDLRVRRHRPRRPEQTHPSAPPAVTREQPCHPVRGIATPPVAAQAPREAR